MPSTDGNEAQTRRMAQQMFEAWESQSGKRNARLAGSVPAWLGVIVSLCTILWAAAFVAGDVDENRRRIDKLEAEVRLQSANNQQVLERLASIEAKLDLITEERKQ